MRGGRRSFVLRCLFGSVAVLGGAVSRAQDPRESLVHAAGRAWLAKTDALDGPGSWEAAGAKFKQQMTTERWTQALQKVRIPLGPVKQRATVSTSFAREFPGVPDGDYAQLQFRTAFEKKADSRESLTLEREADGQWRVIGYFIR